MWKARSLAQSSLREPISLEEGKQTRLSTGAGREIGNWHSDHGQQLIQFNTANIPLCPLGCRPELGMGELSVWWGDSHAEG